MKTKLRKAFAKFVLFPIAYVATAVLALAIYLHRGKAYTLNILTAMNDAAADGNLSEPE